MEIIKSLLDLDFYKLTMGQLVYEEFPDLVVEWKFKNRTNIKLSDYIRIQDLKESINSVRELSNSRRPHCESQYLKNLGIFTDNWIEFFSTFKLPEVSIDINQDGDFDIRTIGFWKETIYWETIVLSIINELYYRNKYSDNYNNILGDEQIKTLSKKIDTLNELKIPFTDFGTRRRFSREWQDKVLSYIVNNSKTFTGTSNVYLAKKWGVRPIGTNAHELYMVAAGFWNDDLVKSQEYITDLWFKRYGYELSIALTDTFGTNQFFKNSSELLKWKGLRHDSGDPFIFGERVIEWYEKSGINPLDKMIVFSDGLDLEKIIRLYDRFNGRIGISFGWGTKLTNDVGLETLSIVMKAVRVIRNGDDKINNHLVKLSDNLNKAMGRKEDIDRYKREFDYINLDSEDLIV